MDLDRDDEPQSPALNDALTGCIKVGYLTERSGLILQLTDGRLLGVTLQPGSPPTFCLTLLHPPAETEAA
jgi:hypothetical protein